VLATDKVLFHGQPVFAVIAETRDQARRAAKLAVIAMRSCRMSPTCARRWTRIIRWSPDPLKLERGDVEAGLAAAPLRLKGEMRIGGQDHFYLEGHIAFAIPGEDDEVTVWSSTQHPSEVQHMVAHALGTVSNAVTVQVRRMGGGFGGKETQSNQFAADCGDRGEEAEPSVKIRPDRDDDMIITGKRHDFVVDYDIGYDESGASMPSTRVSPRAAAFPRIFRDR
jgi:xanthine dehydrogenase large subunit